MSTALIRPVAGVQDLLAGTNCSVYEVGMNANLRPLRPVISEYLAKLLSTEEGRKKFADSVQECFNSPLRTSLPMIGSEKIHTLCQNWARELKAEESKVD